MQTGEVKTSSHLGFDLKTIESSLKLSKVFDAVIKTIEERIYVCTSTPICKSKRFNMDIPFSKHYKHVMESNVQIDNDSGYVSQNHESNSDSALENLNETSQIIMPSSDIKSVYLSEDALLETPEISSEVETVDTSVQGEDSVLVEAADNADTKIFSNLQTSNESGISNASLVVPVISPIIVAEVSNQNGICDTNEDSNVENDVNFLNTITSKDLKPHAYKVCDSFTLLTHETGSNRKVLGSNRSATVREPHTNLFSRIAGKSEPKLQVTDAPKTPQVYKNQVNPNYSPDLFSDEEASSEPKEVPLKVQAQVPVEKYVIKQDRKLVRRVQNALSGVLPPPSFTTVNLSIAQMLEKIDANRHLFWDKNDEKYANNESYDQSVCVNSEKGGLNSSTAKNDSLDLSGSLLVTSDYENCITKAWPGILEERFHGLHYNRSKLSEEFEQLCMKYGARYVGSETLSSCTVFDTSMLSPSKRKASKPRWGLKSPGRRLSHLARRRITFSSANLQAINTLNASTRQVMIDARRFELLSRKRSPRKRSPRKTPKKTPRKSPRKRVRTPTSSAKKRLSLHLQMMSGDEKPGPSSSTLRASATKRALFQSPEHNRPSTSMSKPLYPSTSGSTGLSPFKRRTTIKCALFTSPLKHSPSKTEKRRRSDSDDFHPSKLPRTMTLQENVQTSATSIPYGQLRARSESVSSTSSHPGELSAHHKKKLQWAVYEALRGLNIRNNHPQFRQFASVLARVTRRCLPNLSASGPKPEGGTSERMLRVARLHVYAVTKGKSVEEIMQQIERNKLKHQKPTGYISLQESMKNDISVARNKENVFRDKLNVISSDAKSSLGSNSQVLSVPPNLSKSENRINRVRKVINFDDSSLIGSSNIR